MSSKADQSLFLRFTSTSCIYLLVYVDDIIITRNDSLVISILIFLLNQKFSLEDLSILHYFLGVEVQHTENGGMLLSQEKYLTDILRKVKMVIAEAFSTPMVGGLRLSAHQGEPIPDPKLYRSIVGALQYATITRPEISYSVNKVSQFMHNPLNSHWQAVKRILRYLNGTLHHGLYFSKPSHLSLEGFFLCGLGI